MSCQQYGLARSDVVDSVALPLPEVPPLLPQGQPLKAVYVCLDASRLQITHNSTVDVHCLLVCLSRGMQLHSCPEASIARWLTTIWVPCFVSSWDAVAAAMLMLRFNACGCGTLLWERPNLRRLTLRCSQNVGHRCMTAGGRPARWQDADSIASNCYMLLRTRPKATRSRRSMLAGNVARCMDLQCQASSARTILSPPSAAFTAPRIVLSCRDFDGDQRWRCVAAACFRTAVSRMPPKTRSTITMMGASRNSSSPLYMCGDSPALAATIRFCPRSGPGR